MLWLALASWPYDYYTILRFVVCVVATYGTFLSIKIKKEGWAWCFGIIAVLFNPIVPIHLSRVIWATIDIGVAIILLVSLFFLNEKTNRKKE